MHVVALSSCQSNRHDCVMKKLPVVVCRLPGYRLPRQNIVFVYATRIILHNVSGIAGDTLLVGYRLSKPMATLRDRSRLGSVLLLIKSSD